MDREIDSFLSNECMKAIIELAKNNPNDMNLGKAIRGFIRNSLPSKNKRQLNIQFIQPDMDEMLIDLDN